MNCIAAGVIAVSRDTVGPAAPCDILMDPHLHKWQVELGLGKPLEGRFHAGNLRRFGRIDHGTVNHSGGRVVGVPRFQQGGDLGADLGWGNLRRLCHVNGHRWRFGERDGSRGRCQGEPCDCDEGAGVLHTRTVRNRG